MFRYVMIWLVLGAMAFFTLTSVAHAQAVETWECRDRFSFDDADPVLVVAAINENRVSGTIEVAGETHVSAYGVEGFDRQWSFGPSTGRMLYRYLFSIEPNGDGAYFDFSQADADGFATPRQFFRCRERKNR